MYRIGCGLWGGIGISSIKKGDEMKIIKYIIFVLMGLFMTSVMPHMGLEDGADPIDKMLACQLVGLIIIVMAALSSTE